MYEDLYLPRVPPQSVEMCMMRDFMQFDLPKYGKEINADIPTKIKTKNYGIAKFKVYK